MGMKLAVDSAVADVEKRFDDKLLPWNYKTVMGEITPYPHKNCLDALLVGQDDEATVDPDKHKWDEDGDASIMGAADEAYTMGSETLIQTTGCMGRKRQ